MRNPYVATSRNMWIVSGILIALLSAIHLISTFRTGTCLWDEISTSVRISCLSAWCIVLVVMAWKLRYAQDAFFVVKELKVLVAVVLFGTIGFVMALMQGPAEIDSRGLVFLIFMGILHKLVQMWYPLWKSYELDQTEGESTTQLTAACRVSLESSAVNFPNPRKLFSPRSDFENLLRHPDGLAAFKNFIVLEFSVENLLCWIKLDEVTHKRNLSDMNRNFRDVYNIFVASGSPNEINISSELNVPFAWQFYVEITYLALLQIAFAAALEEGEKPANISNLDSRVLQDPSQIDTKSISLSNSSKVAGNAGQRNGNLV
jgi:hypothetical protein